jgi:hypothetical protein
MLNREFRAHRFRQLRTAVTRRAQSNENRKRKFSAGALLDGSWAATVPVEEEGISAVYVHFAVWCEASEV